MTAITEEQPAAALSSGLVRYRNALRTPGALAFAVPGVVGRMPNAVLSLGLVILLTAVTGSYGIAGAVSAAAALAAGLGISATLASSCRVADMAVPPGFSSGAILALLAAERGIGVRKLSLLEPPLQVEATPPPAATGISGEVARLIVTGRRGEAYEHWMRGIGVPGEMIAGMRQSPLWPALEATAHTLIYDSLIPGSLPPGRLAAISTPTLTVASEGSDDRLRNWVRGVAHALPDASALFLPGTWHGVPAEHLAPALTEFFTGR